MPSLWSIGSVNVYIHSDAPKRSAKFAAHEVLDSTSTVIHVMSKPSERRTVKGIVFSESDRSTLKGYIGTSQQVTSDTGVIGTFFISSVSFDRIQDVTTSEPKYTVTIEMIEQ